MKIRKLTMPILAALLTIAIAGPIWHWRTIYGFMPFGYYLRQQWTWYVVAE